MASQSARPLDGIRVVELGRFVAAPWCGQILADLGADVVKVEHRGIGDPIRQYGPPFLKRPDGSDTAESAYFLACNRGKRSITVDFAKPEGAGIVRRLSGGADVFIENFKAGTLARYGLDEAALRATNPALVYLSISGFGQSGPYADRPSLDSVFQAMGGLMSVTGEADAPPTKIGVTIIDIIAGMYGVIGVLAGLRAREVGGFGGQAIDLALLDSAVATMSHRAQDYLLTGEVPRASGTGTTGSTPAQVFRAADGWINIQAGDEAAFPKLCEFLGLAALAGDPRFARRRDGWSNRAQLLPTVEAAIRRQTVAALYDGLSALDIVCSPIYSLDQTFADPQVVHRGIRREVMHASGTVLPIVASPIRLSATPIRHDIAPPMLGQHSAEILHELGFTSEDVARLRKDSVI